MDEQDEQDDEQGGEDGERERRAGLPTALFLKYFGPVSHVMRGNAEERTCRERAVLEATTTSIVARHPLLDTFDRGEHPAALRDPISAPRPR